MKKSTLFLLIVFFFSTGYLVAQQSNLTDVYFALKNNEIALAKKSIDEAYVHETTKSSAKMYYYRAMVYLQISTSEDKAIKALDSNAAYTSADAFYHFFLSEDKKTKAEINEAKSKVYIAGIYTNNKGIEHLNNEEYEKAIKCFELVRKLTKYDEDEKMKEYDISENKALLNMQIAAERSGDHVLSRKLLNQLIDNNYDDPNLYIYLYNSYKAEKNDAAALKAIEGGIKKYPREKNLLITEMNYYIEKGETSVLMDKFNKLIETDNTNPDYYFYRGTLYHQDKNYTKAEEDYLKAIELDAYNYDVKFNLGVLYIDQSNPVREEMNKNLSNIYKYLDLEDKMYAYYTKALPYFEEVYNANALKSDQEKIQLLEIMRETYKYQKKQDKVIQLSDELDAIRRGN